MRAKQDWYLRDNLPHNASFWQLGLSYVFTLEHYGQYVIFEYIIICLTCTSQQRSFISQQAQ